MSRFSLRQLDYFVAIADSGTLSKAADRLHVSQPTLSQALTDLENALGVQLCVRRKALGITLTPSGTQVLHHARQLLRRAEDWSPAAYCAASACLRSPIAASLALPGGIWLTFRDGHGPRHAHHGK